ncbi:YajG family lipoprotein [Humidesulfovibrio idahonensis]
MTAIGTLRKLILVMGLAAILAGCSANSVVPLRYQPSTSAGAQVCTQTITLLPFADKRTDTITIGSLGEGKNFYAENDVAEWVGWAMFEELKARGCDVKFREKADTSALKGYVVSGSFDTVSVNTGTAMMAKAKLRVRVKVEKDGQFVVEQIYSGERENLGLTYVDAAQKVLASTLQYILQDAATDVVKATK